MVDLKPTVLIVEDEVGPRTAYKVILSPFYTVQVAASAEEADVILREEPVDLLVLDLRLGKTSGIEFLESLRHREEHIPVILITGFGTLHTAREGLRLGAAYHLTKPFNVIELIQAIQDTLKRPAATY